MSFLAGRLAATEGAYFLNESKQAVARLARKKPPSSSPTTANSVARNEDSEAADVLPEVLRHSLPPKIFRSPQSSTSSDSPLTAATKWVVRSDPSSTSFVSPDAMNPLKAYVSIPQVTFGPKRWQLPSSENPLLASTANELRSDRQTTVNPEKLRAAAAGLSRIGKAFAAATTFVFGGAALAFGLAASKMELHNADDVRTKGKDIIHPRFEALKERLSPLRTWAGDVSKKWHWEREAGLNKEKTMMVKELSKILGAKPSS